MEHVTFDVERGTTLAILGGSGSGKSTLLRYMIGLEQPMAGRIDIDGVGEPHRYEGVPPFGETQNYVRVITGRYGKTYHPILAPEEAASYFKRLPTQAHELASR